MAHNVESVIWRRYVEAETNTFGLVLRRQWRRFEAFEGWAYTTPPEPWPSAGRRRPIEQQFDTTDVAVVDNGVDTAGFRPDYSARPDTHEMLFPAA